MPKNFSKFLQRGKETKPFLGETPSVLRFDLQQSMEVLLMGHLQDTDTSDTSLVDQCFCNTSMPMFNSHYCELYCVAVTWWGSLGNWQMILNEFTFQWQLHLSNTGPQVVATGKTAAMVWEFQVEKFFFLKLVFRMNLFLFPLNFLL